MVRQQIKHKCHAEQHQQATGYRAGCQPLTEKMQKHIVGNAGEQWARNE